METSHPQKGTQNTVEDLTVLRHRLEAQSILHQSSNTLHELKHWWRFTPTLNWLITLVGIILTSPPILYIQAVLMGVALVLPYHPFDWIYNYGLRKVTRTAPLPKSGQRRKIMFGFACVLIAVLGIWFDVGNYLAGYIQGGIMVLLGGLLMLFNLCVLSEVLAKIFGMPNR